MSIEPGFGIELSMLMYIGGEWSHVYTYYNHGLEPPYGGVKSGERTDDVEVTLEQHEGVLKWVNEWVRYIKGIVKLPLQHNPDLPLKYVTKVQPDGDIISDVEMETLDSRLIWSKSTNLITVKARPAFDLTWEGFLFYLWTLKDLSDKIKEQS